MQYGDSLILTYDDNKGGLDWDNSGRRIAFESSFEESKNIYFIDFYDLPVTFSNNGFHYAKYINELILLEKETFKNIMTTTPPF